MRLTTLLPTLLALPHRRPPVELQMGLSTDDPRVYNVELDKVTGVDFGCDLSLQWPYVLSMVPDGSAARSGVVLTGDQLVAVAGDSVLGLPIGDVMERLGAAEGPTVDLIFFRGERTQLQKIVGAGSTASATVSVTVQREGEPDLVLEVPYGANLRDELVARKINVYQSITRWTNCNGKQLCGTCIVDVPQGIDSCTRRSLDESSTLRENPETYKLSCITNVYGDITVKLMPKVGAAQWTR
jgi:ferredoxin